MEKLKDLINKFIIGDIVEDIEENVYRIVAIGPFNKLKKYDSTGDGEKLFDELKLDKSYIAVEDEFGNTKIVASKENLGDYEFADLYSIVLSEKLFNPEAIDDDIILYNKNDFGRGGFDDDNNDKDY